MKIIIVNTTKADLRPFHDLLIKSIKAGELDSELADMFTLKIITEGETVKGIITWA